MGEQKPIPAECWSASLETSGAISRGFFPQKAVYQLGRCGSYLVFWTYVPFGKAAMKPPKPPSTLASATAEIMRKEIILCIFIKKPFSSNLSLSGKFVTVPKRYLEQLSSSNSSFTERKLLTYCSLSFPRKQMKTRKHSSRMHTARFCSSGGIPYPRHPTTRRNMGPEIPYPQKGQGHRTRDQEGTWHQRYPRYPACEQNDWHTPVKTLPSCNYCWGR